MTEEKKRKGGGGGKLSRTQTVTVRLDPKLRYLAELAARKQRRTLSSFIEWAIEECLGHVALYEDTEYARTIAAEAANLWDVDDADRFTKLAFRYPEMLTHDEQVLWKLIQKNGLLWRGKYVNDEWTWTVEEGKLITSSLREYWEIFSAVARGETEPSELPNWAKTKSKVEASGEFDDDIPF